MLDIGGGAKPIKGRTKSWDVNKYVVADSLLEGDFQINWHMHIDHPLEVRADEYEQIFCLEVFEYVYNPIVALENIYALLKEGGKALISFPAIYPVHNPKESDYLRYTKAWILKVMDELHFKDVKIIPRRATAGAPYLLNFYAAEKMHPVKNDPVIYDIGYIVECSV